MTVVATPPGPGDADAEVQCAAGDVVTGGGYRLADPLSMQDVRVVTSEPWTSDSWHVHYRSSQPGVAVTVHAVCANL